MKSPACLSLRRAAPLVALLALLASTASAARVAPTLTAAYLLEGGRVQLAWSYAGGVAPDALRVLRRLDSEERFGAPLCDSARDPRCPAPAKGYLDAGPLREATAYVYAVEADFPEAPALRSNAVRVTTLVNRPTDMKLHWRSRDTLEVCWQDASSTNHHFGIRLRDLYAEPRTCRISQVRETADGERHCVALRRPATSDAECDHKTYDLSPERSYLVAVSAGGPGGSSRQTWASIGADNLIHHLDELASRSRFKPFAELVDDSEPGNPVFPSERVITRDGGTGAPLVKLTNSPNRDVHAYSNEWVWNRNGSKLILSSSGPPSSSKGGIWSGRVMNADGSRIRNFLPFDARWDRRRIDRVLFAAVGEDADGGPTTALMGLTLPGEGAYRGFAETLWSCESDPDVRCYEHDTSAVGWTLHPNGSSVAISRGIQDPRESKPVTYVIDLSGEKPSMEIHHPAHAPPHQIWFSKDERDSLYWGARGGDVTRVWSRTAPTIREAFGKAIRLKHHGFSPDGTRLASHQDWVAWSSVPMIYDISDVYHEAPLPLEKVVTYWDSTGERKTDTDHVTWDVDDEWFVVSGPRGNVRVSVDGYGTVVSGPTNAPLRATYYNEGHPSVSRDGTKIAFDSAALGNIDLYYSVMQLPDPPRNPAIAFDGGEYRLRWSPPLHHDEIASYNIWRSERSGEGFVLADRYAPDCPAAEPICWSESTVHELALPDGTGFYHVTAVEHSDLEGEPSVEVADPDWAAGRDRLYWIEVHDGVLTRPMALAYDAEASGLYSIRATDPPRYKIGAGSWCDPAAPAPGCRFPQLSDASLTLAVPTGEFALWLRTRGDPGGELRVCDAAAPACDADHRLGVVPADSADWSWVTLGDTAASQIAVPGALRLVPSQRNVAVDQLLLATNPSHRPSGIGPHPASGTRPAAVADLVALDESDSGFETAHRCHLRWTNPDASNFSHFNVYASSLPDPSWNRERLVGSTVASEFVDWGLRPSHAYRYRVTSVDRRGNESAASETACVTDGIDEFRQAWDADPATGIIAPDPATGRWRFGNIRLTPSQARHRMVAWLRAFAVGQGEKWTGTRWETRADERVPLDAYVKTALSFASAGTVTATSAIRLDWAMVPVAPGASRPRAGDEIWIAIPLTPRVTQANGDQPVPAPLRLDDLAPGAAHSLQSIELIPTNERGDAIDAVLPEFHVTGFVLTNDLSFVPAGKSSFLLPEAVAHAGEGIGADSDGDGIVDRSDVDPRAAEPLDRD